MTADSGELREVPPALDLPVRREEVLADGREVVVSGDLAGWADVAHVQGENLYGYLDTCGVVGCEGVLRRFGVETSENALLEHALAEGRCDRDTGRVSLADQVGLLEEFGVPAHIEHHGTVDALAADVEAGQGVLAQVNAGVLLDRPDHYGTGSGNHGVVVTGVARDPATNAVVGVFINDPVTGEAGRMVSRELLEAAWVDAGGVYVVTDAGEPGDTDRVIGDWVWYDGHWISF